MSENNESGQGIPALYSDLYFTCSSGITPAKICPTQQNHKCKEQGIGEFPYLIHHDTATQNIGDFFCRWTLVLAAAVAAAGVVTGGAALVALAAVALIASGTLCGGLMAPLRKWVGYKTDNTYGRGEMPSKWFSDLTMGFMMLSGAAFVALAIVSRCTGSMDKVLRRIYPPKAHEGGYSLIATCSMVCPIGGVVTYAPGITGFWSAAAYTARNVGFAVLEGIFWGKFASVGGTFAAGKATVSLGKAAINFLFLQGTARAVGTADQVFVEGMLRDGKEFSETGEYAIRGATMFEQPFINMYKRINEGYYTGSYAKDANGNTIEDAQNYHGAGALVTDFYYATLTLMGLKAMVDVSRTTPNVPLETLKVMRAQIKALTKFGKGILLEKNKLNEPHSKNKYRDGVENIKENTRSIEEANFTKEGIEIIENHLKKPSFSNNGKLYAENKIMIERLKAISDGKLEATQTDKAFYTHELRETQLMKDGLSYDEAHAQTCKEYGITTEMEQKSSGHPFYTDEAIQAGDAEAMSMN